jgi:hypothetical protein
MYKQDEWPTPSPHTRNFPSAKLSDKGLFEIIPGFSEFSHTAVPSRCSCAPDTTETSSSKGSLKVENVAIPHHEYHRCASTGWLNHNGGASGYRSTFD